MLGAGAIAQAPILGFELLTLIIGLVLIAAVILVGRFILNVAWRLVMVALIVIGAFYVATLFIPGVL